MLEVFDCNPPLQARLVFLDISKDLDKVLHQGLLYKFKCADISGKLYDFHENYLSGRFHRVISNGQTSFLRHPLGVPQSSILGPFLFLIYINNFPNEVKPNTKLFADNTSLFTVVKDKNESANTLNNNLLLILKFIWKMLFKADPNKPSQEVSFSNKRRKFKFIRP